MRQNMVQHILEISDKNSPHGKGSGQFLDIYNYGVLVVIGIKTVTKLYWFW
jgi:hypothetical protein